MDRRDILRGCLGAFALAVGGSLIASTAAEARIPAPGPLPTPEPTAEPAVATEADIADAGVENVQYYYRRRRYWRRRHYWRRPRYHWRRRAWGRRCWINRWGNRVCRF